MTQARISKIIFKMNWNQFTQTLKQLLHKTTPQTVEQEALPHGGIVMYCSSWCPDCRQARAWLQAHQLPYTEVDIDDNPAAKAQVKQWSGGNLTTPTFDINGTIVVDFDQERLAEILKLK